MSKKSTKKSEKNVKDQDEGSNYWMFPVEKLK